MKKQNKIMIGLIMFLVIGLVILLILYVQNQKCVGEGGTINTMPGPKGKIISPRCCEDLTQISIIKKEGENIWVTQTDGALCTKCGDGICKKPENIKNCPKDCGEIS